MRAPTLVQHLATQLAALAPASQSLAVALSGGGDSWALALLVHDYCKNNSLPFIAVTVDHRLRPESAAEAAAVATECATRGIPHQTLTWQHDGIATRKQEQARTARYDLLANYCETHGFTQLLTAHHADDQAETVLLRFAKGSGAKGLAGMAPSRQLTAKITLVRPFLAVPKTDLMAYAMAAGVPIMVDPSNENPDYARPRLRAARAVLEAEGLTTETLLKGAAAAAAEDAALDHATCVLLLKHATFMDGTASLPLAAWIESPLALQARALTALWQQLTGSPRKMSAYPPEREALERLCIALSAAPCRRTLGGLIIERTRDRIALQPEFPAKS